MSDTTLDSVIRWAIGFGERVLLLILIVLFPIAAVIAVVISGPWWLLTGRDPLQPFATLCGMVFDK